MAERRANVARTTSETKVDATVAIDGGGDFRGATGVGFLDHMLAQLARHGLFDIEVNAVGDLHIDAHHTAEDVAIVLGRAFSDALGDRQLHLIQSPDPEGDRQRRINRADHVALEVRDIQAVRNQLGEAGIEFREGGNRDLGIEQLFCHDPDGHVIEFVHYLGTDQAASG